MAENAFHLQNSTTLDWDIDGTAYPVAGVTEATFSISSSVVELETGDSVLRQDHYHEGVRFPVTITARKWDHEIINEVLGTPSSGAFEDRSALPRFSITGTFETADDTDSKTVDIGVSDIPVPEDLPIFDLSMGEYGEWTIESDGGTLDTFTINTTV
jgi:hypothetical protein